MQYIDFRSPEKNNLPIKGLPKKGVNQLFANAVRYFELHDKMEQYARLAIKDGEWYKNLTDKYCAVPGTFAVFALGLHDEFYSQLVLDYLAVCDGEHQSVHGWFVLAYIEKYGFTETGLEIYRLCEENIKGFPTKLYNLKHEWLSKMGINLFKMTVSKEEYERDGVIKDHALGEIRLRPSEALFKTKIKMFGEIRYRLEFDNVEFAPPDGFKFGLQKQPVQIFKRRDK